MPPKTAAASQTLPAKEQGLFKQLLQMYEAKQHKKAIKTADQILKKFPEHGETLCMKGLLFSMTGKKEEGLDMAKRGARFNLMSHIVWHVLGLIHKAERNYEEANRSYGQALRIDKENVNLLRDAASLQMQLRLFDALQETRWTILRLRPNVRSHWIGLAVACQLGGNLEQADKVLSTYRSMLTNVPDYDFDWSETTLYHIRILEQLGRFEEGLTLLESSAKSRSIVDRLALLELRPRLLIGLDRKDAAEEAIRALITRNPDHADYIDQLLALKGIQLNSLTDETRSQALAVLVDLESTLPKGSAPTRIALDVASGDEFATRARQYIESGLQRGVPSLFTDLKPLYADPAKRDAIEQIASTFHDSVEPTQKGEPSTYLWTLFFLAQHWSKLGNQQRALELVDVALTHTPTLPELYTLRGRVLRRAGAPQSAAIAVERARLLDGQDRFLNGKAAKYFLRAGRVEDADTRLAMFTRKDSPFPGADLEELQSTTFLLQAASAHEGAGRLGKALRKYMGVVKIFEDVEDDQYDFHGYVMRRFTVNVYSDFLTYLNRSRSQVAYIDAALGATRLYLRLHDEPGLAAALLAPPKQTEAEKKAKKKAQKEAAKAKEMAAKAAAISKASDKKADDDEDEPAAGPTKYDDQDGVKLLNASDPIEQAARILRPLESLVERADVWAAVYDVAVRRKKWLQAAKALNKLAKLDRESPLLHVRLIDLRTRLAADGADASPVVKESLAALFPEDIAAGAFSSQYLQQHSSNAAAVVAVASVSPLAQAEELVFGLVQPEASPSIENAQDAVALLTKLESARVQELRDAFDARFTLSTIFKPVAEQERLAKLESDALDVLPNSDEVLDLPNSDKNSDAEKVN